MKKVFNFIFYTNEGSTFQPNSEDDMPDIENCQLLGFGKGDNAEEAFKDFKKESIWLEEMSFKKAIGVELKNEEVYYFSLDFKK
jgi:hypothetical protein